MLGLTCIPEKIYDFLYPIKAHFRCSQARHFMLFCWLLMLLVDSNNNYAHYCFGFEMVLLIASWDHYHVPVAICAMDPHRKGQQNIIFRRMLRKFVPPGWAGAVVVEADAGFAANRTIKPIKRKKYGCRRDQRENESTSRSRVIRRRRLSVRTI
jgi:hypothetical protein